MYIYDGSKYTEEEIQNAANKAGLSLEEYTSKNNITFEEEKKVEEVAEVKTKEVSQDTTSADLLDPTTFQEDAAAGADAVSQPMTASQAGYVEPEDTESALVDTSLDLPKTEEELRIANIDKTLNKAGSSIWNYSPDNISDLYLKTTGKGVEYQTISTPSILGLGGPEVKYTGIFGDNSSVLTGKFSYDDFAQNEKINGVSIAELQAEDQNKAANNALNVIIKKHGDKSNEFVLKQGSNILKGADKELKTLYSSLKTVADKDKQVVLDKIQEIRDDESRELYDIRTGDLVKYKDLSEEDKKEENTRSEKATEIAETTELSKIEDQLTKSYSNLVGISNRISDFIKDNGEEEITRDSQTSPAVITNVVKDFFGSEETVYGDLERVQQIALTNELPENISKINGNHPLAKAYNSALEEYVILNKAVQTNTDPLSEEQEGFWESAGEAVLEKIDLTGGDATPKLQYATNRAFIKSAEKAGLGGINDEQVDEALSQNWRSVVGGGTVDLTMFVGELMLFKNAGGNKIQKGFKLMDKAFKASKAAKSSKVLRKAGDLVIKGLDEAAVFTGLETTKSTLGLSQQSTREQEWATATFGFSLGAGNSLGAGLLRAIPSKTIFSPVIAQLSKSDFLKDVGSRFVNASAGAFSFEFATALEAIQNPEGKGYGPRGESTYFEQSPEEFIFHYLGETAKMGLLGSKSIFHKNGMYEAAQRDMRLLNLNPTYVNKAAKKTGIDAESVRKPGEETVNEINSARVDKMAGIDAKLKTEQITEEQAKKEIDAANKDYNILEAEAELNLAKERFKAEDKSALKPTDESVRILIQKMKKGEKFNDKDNNALVNTPLPIIYARMGMNPSSKSLDGRWNREFVIEDILNNNINFKAGYGTKERADSYNFINEYFEVGGKIKALENIKNKNEGQEKELESLTKDLENYNPGGYKYDKLQDKLDQYYLEQRQQNKAQAKDVLGATKEGESVSIRSVEDFQDKYNTIKKDGEDVRFNDGFYDAENKTFYINEKVAAAIRNVTVDKHEVGHFVLRDSLKDKAGKVTDEGIKVVEEVLSELTPKQRETVQKRIDKFYRYDKKGKEKPAKDYYEEYITVLSDAITEKQIVFKENVGNALEKFVPFLRKKMPELELNADTGKNLFDLVKSYSKGEKDGIEAAKKMSIAAEGKDTSGQETSKSISAEGDSKTKIKLDGFTGPAENRKFKTKKEWESSDEYVDAYNYFTEPNPQLDARIRSIAAGKKVDFIDVEKVKDVLSMRFVQNFNIEKNSLFGWMLGKNPALKFAVLDVIEKETAKPVTISTTTREGGTMEVEDTSMSIEDQIDASLARKEQQNIESQIKTTIKKGGERFIDEDLRKVIKTGAENIFSSKELTTKRDIKNALKNKVNEKNIESYDVNGKTLKNTSIFTITKKKIGKLPDFIEENYESLFHTEAVPISYLVNFERLTPETEKIFTGAPTRLTNQKLIDKAIKLNNFHTENERTGPMFYPRRKPSLEEVQDFFKVRGRDNAFVNMLAGTAITDATPGALKEIQAEDRKIAETALKLGVDVEVKFSSTIKEIKENKIENVSELAEVSKLIFTEMFTKKIKGKIDYTSGSIQEAIYKDSSFKVNDEKGYENLIKKYINGELKVGLATKLDEIAAEALYGNEVIQAMLKENEIFNAGLSRKIINSLIPSGLNVVQNDYLKHGSPEHNAYVETVKELGIIEMIPKEVFNFKTTESGKSPVLAQTLGYNGTEGKSTSKFLEDFKESIEKTVTNPEAKAIWKPVLEAMNIEGNTFFSETSKGANKNSMGQIRNIQSKPIKALSKKDKGKEIDKVYKSNLEKSNKINTLYHNAIIETINLSLNSNKKIGFGYSTARNEAVKKLSTIFTNNKSFGFRLASPFTIVKYFIEGTKKNFSNEHLKESAKFKAGAINVLLSGEKNIEKALEKLNTGYESVLTDNVSRKEADTALGKVISPNMQSYLKLVGPDAMVLTSEKIIERLDEYYYMPGKISLGQHVKNVALKNSIPPNKTNLKILAKAGANIKNIKTNIEALVEIDKIDVENTKKISFSSSVKSEDLSKTFNKIIENKTGVKAEDVFSESRGVKAGKNKGRLDLFIPPSAEDFVGLLYKTLGKGKEGDAQLAWYKKNLLDPFARGDAAVTNERNALMRDFKQIKKEITEAIASKDWKGTSPLTKKMKDKLPGLEYTGEDALRMYIWSKQGNEIPSIDKAEVDAVIKEFVKNPELIDFANKIRLINKGTPYPEPSKNWVSGNVSTDLLQGINTTKRAQHLEQWQANVDQIFSKENLNKLEGVYGKSYRKAMENMLHRMKTGRNRNISGDYLGGRVTDWVNNSTGAIMFLNQRSAVLQLISASNFVNMSDNNIFKAGTAFANQPQYWSDFKMLFNSEYLKNRRGGLEFNVTESEIADIAKAGGINGVIAKILKVGFTPTQLADSFAIASGGSTFFRNRYKTYLKETNAEGEKVYTEKEAKEKAFLDFKETAEESQQSSRPDKISQQQSGILGRTVLSFANTPSQYARIIKKSAMDLKAGRGDQKTNISKIVYYSFLQNVLFNGLQKALFMDLMGDDDDDTTSTAAKRKAEAKTQNKYIDVVNGMTSSLLRGSGVSGNIVNSLKDMGLEIYKQQGKTVQDYDRVADAALGFSPPIRYKYQQIKSAGRKFTYPGSRQEVIDKGFSIDNPALMAGAQVTSALTNIPLDRAMRKINNIVDATTMELDEIQRLGLLLGWSKYDLNIPKDKKKSSKKKKKNAFKIPKFKTPKFK